MCSENMERKASLPPQAGGMPDVQLRRYNTPNNDERVFSEDPVYVAFPDLREKMKARTLTGKEYVAAMDAYTAERIMLLAESDAKYVKERREQMLRRELEAMRPWVLKDGNGNTWLHPTAPRYAAH